MKNNKNLLNRVIAGSLATGVMVSSCTNGGSVFLPMDEDDLNEAIRNNDIGEAVVSVSLSFTDDEKAFISAIEKIAVKVLEDSAFANEFAEKPDSVLREYGCNVSIDDGGQLIKFVSALGNEEIRRSIEEKNLSKFLELCDKYNLLPSQDLLYLRGSDIGTLSIEPLPGGIDQGYNFYFTLGAIAVAVTAVLVVAGLGIVMNVAGVADAALWVTHRGDTRSMETEDKYMLDKNVDVLDLYILKNGSDDIYIQRDKCIEDIVNQSLPFFKEKYPDYFQTHSDEDFKNLLRINLLNR